MHTVNRCNVTIISGETGSGKSTQSVQFVLDDLIQRQLGAVANIICTQPRRISALGLADRVADERCARVGDEIGYTIRGESKQKPGVTKITFVTTGVLLRRLQTSGGGADDVVAALADISHVVVDEVHERSLDTDFLLVLLRQILRTRKDLKVILMSATLDADVFEAYFREVGPVGRVEIAGRTHPVTDYYVDDVMHFTGFRGYFDEDEPENKSFSANLRSIGFGINYDLIAETVRHIDHQLGAKDGGILIFLPGTMEIDRTIQALSSFPNLHALPLHASLMPADQKRVFPLPPAGKRKVIAATNVAETSITIEDIVAVIDTGRVKETSYDPQNNMVRLAETWASRAACKQRRGRAGRVRAGDCYKLYTRNAEAKMLERPDPEIRRVPLEQMCLSIKAMGVHDVSGFLASALTPPESTAVEGAVKLLSQMGAITDNELTALGRHMSMIPADLRLSKLLVYGATFGCLEAALTIASVLTARSPFISPRRETRRQGMSLIVFALRSQKTKAIYSSTCAPTNSGPHSATKASLPAISSFGARTTSSTRKQCSILRPIVRSTSLLSKRFPSYRTITLPPIPQHRARITPIMVTMPYCVPSWQDPSTLKSHASSSRTRSLQLASLAPSNLTPRPAKSSISTKTTGAFSSTPAPHSSLLRPSLQTQALSRTSTKWRRAKCSSETSRPSTRIVC